MDTTTPQNAPQLDDKPIKYLPRILTLRLKLPEESCSLCHQTYEEEYTYSDRYDCLVHHDGPMPMFVIKVGDNIVCKKCFVEMYSAVESSLGGGDIEQALNHLRYGDTQIPFYRKKKVPFPLRREVLERDSNTCLCCGATSELCIDHIVPEVQGGTTDIKNLQTLCRKCNGKKRLQTIDYRTTS